MRKRRIIPRWRRKANRATPFSDETLTRIAEDEDRRFRAWKMKL
jgi:hypothetical protein